MKKTMSMSSLPILCLATLVSLALTGCKSTSPQEANTTATTEMRQLINKNVEDTERAGKMITIVDQLEKELNDFVKVMTDRQQALAQTNADYTKTRSDMEAQYDLINKDLIAIEKRIVDAHLGMKTLATEDEWNAIAKKKDKLLFGVK